MNSRRRSNEDDLKLAKHLPGAVAVLLLSAGLVASVGAPASAATDLSALSGYYLDTTWVAPGNDVGLLSSINTATEPACLSTSPSDTPDGEGYFYNGSGSPVSVLAKNGRGFGDVTNGEYFTIPATIAAATPIIGTFRFLCSHTNGSATQTVESLPLTVTAVAPSSEFHSALQETTFSPGDL
jgi:hypothetical protein